jgi:hypothetical protein
MGDRVLMQCHSSREGTFGPVLYCHWGGSSAKKIVENLRAQMQSRPGDVEYSTARLVQCAIPCGDVEPAGFGVWNAEHLLTAADSHGDAGVVLIDVANRHAAVYLGGYLSAEE